MISLQAVPVRNSAFTVRDVGEETIIISDKGDMLHTLNPVGASIWRNIDGKRCILDLMKLLLTEYAVSETVARKDILSFFEGLSKKAIVKCQLHT